MPRPDHDHIICEAGMSCATRGPQLRSVHAASRRTPGPIASVIRKCGRFGRLWKPLAFAIGCGGYGSRRSPGRRGYKYLNPARRQYRAFCPVGGDIDEAGMNTGEGLATFRSHRVMNGRAALGHNASVRTAETAEKSDVADGVVVIVAQRQRDQRL